MERWENLVKLMISSFFWTEGVVSNRFRQMVGKKARTPCVVLYYHGITGSDRTRFGKQMGDLKRLAKAVSADRNEMVAEDVPSVAVTFDDGFQSILENALPELIARRIPASFFIPTGYIGQKASWIGVKADEDHPEVVMTEEQIRGLPKDLINVGSHTVSHQDLRKLGNESLRKEIVDSKKRLEEIIGQKVTMISLPYGEHDERVIEAAHGAGYRWIFSSLPRLIGRREGVIERVPVRPSDRPLEFRLKIMGAYRWLPFVLGLKRKLSLLWD